MTPRTPIDEDIEVAVLGGGIAGLLAGAYLKKAGVDDVHVIEMGGDFGGVWYWNRFPGIQCDNDAYCYIPMLEELDFMPSKKFADGAEIFEHCRGIGKHFGLYDGAIFSTQVRDGALGRGDQALAVDHQPRRRHPGPLRGHGAGLVQPAEAARHPRDQGLQGATSSTRRAGTTTTPAETPTADCTSCADKRVALVGTGATGVQLVPHLGRDAKHLYVFQRTPSSVDDARQRADRSAVGGIAAARLAGGAQAQLPLAGHRSRAWCSEQPDLVCDFWTELGPQH